MNLCVCVCVFQNRLFFTFLTSLDVFPSFYCAVILNGAFKTVMTGTSEMGIVVWFLVFQGKLLVFCH